jgi:uncharacterized membrane protein YgaE (UPF0421/DUF939 family)
LPSRLDPASLRNSLKLAVAALITAAIAVHFDRIEFLWYPLLAVVVVVDDNDDHTLQAASGRVMGNVLGGLITFLVHTVLSGWMGVLVSLLVMMPALHLMGWQSALGTALAVLSVSTGSYGGALELGRQRLLGTTLGAVLLLVSTRG